MHYTNTVYKRELVLTLGLMVMPILVVMIGIQGSGKSSFCREYLSSYKRISLDELQTRNKERAAIITTLDNGIDIVVDNTNPTIEDRKKYLDLAKTYKYKTVAYFMQSKIKDCIERNRQRAGKARVPDTAIAATSNKLQMPTYAEGFDEIYYVSIAEDGFKLEEWRE